MELTRIDGSMGEGGGQILRSSLSLAMCLGKGLHLYNIRSRRSRPGLLHQHLTAVKAAAEICRAQVDGAEQGASELTFVPGPVQGGDYHFDIGTAGSATLVLQTILLPLLYAKSPSTIVIEGGTHNPNAPPFDFLQKSYLPLLNRMGADISARLLKPGFYPAGGGRVELDVSPCHKLTPLHLPGRGQLRSNSATVYLAGLPAHIASRELDILRKELHWPEQCFKVEQIDNCGQGNVITLELVFDHVTELFTGFGMKGKRAEIVAEEVIREMRNYLKSEVAVGPHLADQIMLPMALAGCGSYTTGKLTTHSRTNVVIIELLLDCRFEIKTHDGIRFEVIVGRVGKN